jgi:hypothetical protein
VNDGDTADATTGRGEGRRWLRACVAIDANLTRQEVAAFEQQDPLA